jgi:hypothetical protein
VILKKLMTNAYTKGWFSRAQVRDIQFHAAKQEPEAKANHEVWHSPIDPAAQRGANQAGTNSGQ